MIFAVKIEFISSIKKTGGNTTLIPPYSPDTKEFVWQLKMKLKDIVYVKVMVLFTRMFVKMD